MYTRVFVYGSLRRYQSNHGLMATAVFRGACQLPGFAMYDLGPYPAALRQDTADVAVHGEVYDVDAGTFRELDILEGLGEEYCRERVLTPYGEAWIYLYLQPLGRSPLIPEGDWVAWAERQTPETKNAP
ncbi:gamma-glutamylcyclotransferase [Photobacterium sp. CCB-ST2H9]|uniref:gamma-glutamylcyclotransferase family protein n=1 Tax=Photobacterium sp. CCB-ST2H9 TaxID=2912855 RepID=UPI002002B4DA|nr:gamma-glutamylcyclotransferase family protein [Photobacterium sp. CCB-ST2H9]UTM56991.1 gamma-glutamylcyclotransferase [Photobacterium sp. CCB-ST2H9]